MTVFLANNKDIFARDMSQLGQTHLVTHHIDTGDAAPIKQRPYRTAPALNAEIERQVNEMLNHGIVQPSTSPWSSPVVLVKKKDSTYRFAVDYRKLNKVSRPIYFPLPRLDDALDIMGKSSIFSTLDLFSGFWQIPLDEESQEKSTFTTLWSFQIFEDAFWVAISARNVPSTYESVPGWIDIQNMFGVH
jgi:hypothetical protein